MWVPFENEEQLGPFLDAVADLHRPLLDQLTAGERPFFFHHWATRLNLCDCYLLSRDGQPVAIAAYPRVVDKHYERWQSNSLAVHPEYDEPLELPCELDKSALFAVPAHDFTTETGIDIRNAVVKTEQIAYTRNIDGFVESRIESDWGFRIPAPEQLEAMIEIFSCRDRPSPGSDSYLDYYLPILTWNIRRVHSLGTAFCYCATERGGDVPIAAALYSGWELPLAGVSCALVDDILVLPEYRGRGIAAILQNFAYANLNRTGINWITGNIDPENPASLRQAEKANRQPWTISIRVSPA